MTDYERGRRDALEEAAFFVESQRGGFTRNEVDLLHSLARELRALADKPVEPEPSSIMGAVERARKP